MRAGDRIRVDVGFWNYATLEDFTVEEFRDTLGIFKCDDARATGSFTPLCELYGKGPDSKREYRSNWGEYTSNQVPIYMNLPRIES